MKNWRANIHQLWKVFVRNEFGTPGYATWRAKKAISFRRVFMDEKDRRGLVIEEAIAAPEAERLIDFRSLAPRQRMIVCLLQCGFSLKEIHSELLAKGGSYSEERKALQQKVSESVECEEVLEKPLSTLTTSEVRFSAALAKRKRLAASVDLSLGNLSN